MTKLRGELAQLYREMRPEGWAVSFTAKGHIRWYHAETGAEVVSSRTVGNYRVRQEIRTDLRRAVRYRLQRAG